ncbi:glycosyltransferase family 2 protein [bacterium]|nr:glycosyltransferase family 2 protein [bacterium]
MTKISAIVIVKDEAGNIAECLKSLSFTDEVVVVDSGSKDGTVEIAKKYTDKVFITEWKGYSGTKQFALNRASGEWIFWLDADERVSPQLADEIGSAIIEDRDFAGYMMPRKAFFLGRWIRHGGWYPGYVVRLFRKEKGTFGDERVHERLHIDGPVGTLKEPIYHYTDNSIDHYFKKFNVYTTLAVIDLEEMGRKVSILTLLIRPIHMFIKMYIFRAGFLDGIEGLLLAVFSANYVFVKYAKFWELGKKKKQTKL